MKLDRTFISRSLASLAIAGSLMVLSAPVLSQPAEDQTARQNQMHERIKARLDKMAERLQIDASQQEAWAAYAKTVEGLIGKGLTKPPADADAAALVRFRAQRAAEHAQKLTQLADATATLQQTLNPEQQKVLDEIVRKGPMGHGAGGRHPHRQHR